ncbi:MAG: hypothetical protein JSR97_01225 [Verrucomicrobia bacterium]|nr:hypothetical protein [Verrucomicrobiota bacterium]
MITIIEKYLLGITSDKFHRYRSWDNCHQSFSANKATETHCLELAFYLASWGMYRGSSGLLQKNHLIHQGAVEILFAKDNLPLKCNSKQEMSPENIPHILRIQKQLATHYSNILFTRGSALQKPITPTDTLTSKILLGTLACVPAYDRYFITGLNETGLKHSKFNSDSLKELFSFINDNKAEIKKCQTLIQQKIQRHYPVMKVLDMYFWQVGYNKDIKRKDGR